MGERTLDPKQATFDRIPLGDSEKAVLASLDEVEIAAQRLKSSGANKDDVQTIIAASSTVERYGVNRTHTLDAIDRGFAD